MVHTKWDVIPAFEQANYCCQGQPISVVKQRASGEWRHPCGWSAIVAYANCNHAPVTPWPSKITPMQNGSNPNGHCLHGTTEELLAPPVPIDEEPAAPASVVVPVKEKVSATPVPVKEEATATPVPAEEELAAPLVQIEEEE